MLNLRIREVGRQAGQRPLYITDTRSGKKVGKVSSVEVAAYITRDHRGLCVHHQRESLEEIERVLKIFLSIYLYLSLSLSLSIYLYLSFSPHTLLTFPSVICSSSHL